MDYIFNEAKFATIQFSLELLVKKFKRLYECYLHHWVDPPMIITKILCMGDKIYYNPSIRLIYEALFDNFIQETVYTVIFKKNFIEPQEFPKYMSCYEEVFEISIDQNGNLNGRIKETEHIQELFESLKENFELCKYLCEEFKKQNKLVVLTLSAVVIVQYYIDRIKEIANMSDMIIGNMEETEVLAGGKSTVFQDTYEKVHRLLSPKNRLLVVTCGSHGVYCSKYNYQGNRLELTLQCFPNFVKNDEIVDLNGAGDAFLGGFLAMYLKGNTGNKLYSCCRSGNDAASVILRNVGCTYPKNFKLNLEEQD